MGSELSKIYGTMPSANDAYILSQNNVNIQQKELQRKIDKFQEKSYKECKQEIFKQIYAGQTFAHCSHIGTENENTLKNLGYTIEYEHSNEHIYDLSILWGPAKKE